MKDRKQSGETGHTATGGRRSGVRATGRHHGGEIRRDLESGTPSGAARKTDHQGHHRGPADKR